MTGQSDAIVALILRRGAVAEWRTMSARPGIPPYTAAEIARLRDTVSPLFAAIADMRNYPDRLRLRLIASPCAPRFRTTRRMKEKAREKADA